MFPYTHDRPTFAAKQSANVQVPFSIRFQFIFPKNVIRFRHRSVGGTRMPETPIDKNGQFCRTQNEIWPDLNGWRAAPLAYNGNADMPSPARYALCTQRPGKHG